ncbi:MAG: DUF6920 family protein [Ktedonobacteraceae bacterium]
MSQNIHNDGPALLQYTDQEWSGFITEDQVLAMPEPMQRYLTYVQVVGKEPTHTVRLSQKGYMRQKPGQKWTSLSAKQYFTTNPPTFLWHGSMRPFPFFWMTGTDRFSDGHGSMRIKLLSVIPLPLASGPKMDQGELQRYLGEIIWFPTAWFSNAIDWQVIDKHSVQATLHEPGVTGSVVLHVNEQGQLTLVTAQRYMGNQGILTPWSIHLEAYREVNGMHIPTVFEVTWHPASGDFTWFRGQITEIEYNQSGKFTRFEEAT